MRTTFDLHIRCNRREKIIFGAPFLIRAQLYQSVNIPFRIRTRLHNGNRMSGIQGESGTHSFLVVKQPRVGVRIRTTNRDRESDPLTDLHEFFGVL